jgi:hypothetical protein
MVQVPSLVQRLSRTSRLTPIVPFLILLLCFCSCKDTINSLGELGQLRNDLIKEFHESNITVSLNNSTNLAVTFTNSPLNAALSNERFRRAQETALFIKRRYVGIGGIETMLVRFMTQETRMFVVQETREIDSFVFGKNASLIGAPPGDDPQNSFNDEQDVGVTYNAARNESEVRVRQIQLEGDMEQGLGLSLHFKVRGDATTAGHASGIPASIVFTFSSFAPAKVFKTDPPLKLVADGAVVFSDKAHNLSATTEGGNEFLVQAVPLDQFLKLADASTVVLGLGTKEYLLGAKQLSTLRKMADYANAGRASQK